MGRTAMCGAQLGSACVFCFLAVSFRSRRLAYFRGRVCVPTWTQSLKYAAVLFRSTLRNCNFQHHALTPASRARTVRIWTAGVHRHPLG